MTLDPEQSSPCRGAPVLVTPPEAGKYEEYGYGIMGYYVGDLLATHKWNKSARAVDYVCPYIDGVSMWRPPARVNVCHLHVPMLRSTYCDILHQN
jgi:hypothetical protein